MNSRELPNIVNGSKLITQFPVNDHFQIGVFEGKLSPYDILIKYKQLINGKWTRPRTPKHIHWAVDILIKQNEMPEETSKFIDFLINYWNSVPSISSKEELDSLLNVEKLTEEVNQEASDYSELAKKGEYSIKFLLLLAKLLMFQEKTNRSDAYMFKMVLEKLKDSPDIFSIVSAATYRKH